MKQIPRDRSSHLFHRYFRLWLCSLSLVLLILAACGSDPGVGSGGSGYSDGTQIGVIDGFGSVIVEGNTYDDTSATVSIHVQPGNADAAGLDELGLGMQVRLSFDQDSKASAIYIEPQIIGSVDAAQTDRFAIAGQQVSISSRGELSTVFEGFDSLSELPGERVVVFGQFDQNGELKASRVELAGERYASISRITGVAQEVTQDAAQFKLGTLLVRQSLVTTTLPANQAITNGSLLVVWADAESLNGELIADRIRVLDADTARRGTIRLGGPIRQVQNDGRLQVDRSTVDPSSAEIIGGSLQDLQAGRFVRISGTRQGNQVTANTITLTSQTADALQRVGGHITDYFGPSSFRVRKTLIDASSGDVSFIGGTSANLADNVIVDVEGVVQNGVLKARSVRLRVDESSGPTFLLGSVANYRSVLGLFDVVGVPARLAFDASYFNPDGSPAQRSDFADGRQISVAGNYVAGLFIVQRIDFVDGAQSQATINGRAHEINRVTRRLVVNRVDIRWSATTTIVGDINRLEPGRPVQVVGTIENGLLMANQLTILE